MQRWLTGSLGEHLKSVRMYGIRPLENSLCQPFFRFLCVFTLYISYKLHVLCTASREKKRIIGGQKCNGLRRYQRPLVQARLQPLHLRAELPQSRLEQPPQLCSNLNVRAALPIAHSRAAASKKVEDTISGKTGGVKCWRVARMDMRLFQCVVGSHRQRPNYE
jgi:hypothetical protein